MANGSMSMSVPSGREVVADVRAGAGRVAHVVQAVEEAHQVVRPGERRRRRDLEAHPVGQPGVGGALAGGVDRAVVGVEADDGRRGIGLGEQQRRCAVAATDVGDRRAPPASLASTPSSAGIQALARWLR